MSDRLSELREEARAHARQIEAVARDHAADAELPDFGAPIAWAITARSGQTTVDFSPLHRVGEPIGGHPYAVCREKIPAPVLWFSLSPAIIRTMPRCGYCEAGVARAQTEAA